MNPESKDTSPEQNAPEQSARRSALTRLRGRLSHTDATTPLPRLRTWLSGPRGLLVLVLVLLVGFGLAARFRQRVALSAENKALAMPTVSVVSAMSAKGAAALAIPGEIKPWIEAPIYSRANGYLKRRYVDIGDEVKEGQLLAELDTPEASQDLERARAQLKQTEASLALSKSTAGRWEQLLKSQSVSDQEASEKLADHKLKAATTDAARAEVRRLQEVRSFARITAPFSGTITARNIDNGDLIVSGGAKELFHLAQTKRLRVFVQVPMDMARGVEAGQSAEVSLPEFPGQTFAAKVIRSAGAFTDASRTMQVELEVDNSNGKILAGGYAQVRFTEAKLDAALTLPSNTLLFRAEGPQVGVVLPDGTVELRKVTLGRDFGQTIEIASGITPKDRVIVNPSDSLAAGVKVAVLEPKKAESPKAEGQPDAKPKP
jgi:RND family efflux transporter MFP subunit